MNHNPCERTIGHMGGRQIRCGKTPTIPVTYTYGGEGEMHGVIQELGHLCKAHAQQLVSNNPTPEEN